MRGLTRVACCLLVVLATAGCLTGAGVSNDAAKERALDAEEAYITDRFEDASCVESWSLISFVGIDEEATVVNRTADGVYVDVTHPLSYATDDEEADVATEATYLVTEDDVRRVSGTNLSPC
ncbi:hypothetical protein [Halorubellus salinus]|uniref:hypothetical protein n=1 Tax=Halorubellus salinus TaxID=755309 RepID=UPI001D08D338|nr:hypothetical protein [Halorubellus salinus]